MSLNLVLLDFLASNRQGESSQSHPFFSALLVRVDDNAMGARRSRTACKSWKCCSGVALAMRTSSM